MARRSTRPQQTAPYGVALLLVAAVLVGTMVVRSSGGLRADVAVVDIRLTASDETSSDAAERPDAATLITDVSTGVSESAIAGEFGETFDGNSGRDNFDIGVYHRDGGRGSWLGDHPIGCGPPEEKRIIDASRPSDSVYVCNDHMMTSMGDVSGYSIVWFSPKQTFNGINRVCVDVNLTTAMGTRQWWKIAVVEAGANPLFSNIDASNLPGLEGPDRLVATWSGPNAWAGQLLIGDGGDKNADEVSNGDDIRTRSPVCLKDNRDGTVTFTVRDLSITESGSFPSGPLRVYFQDHNYTPDKSDSGRPSSYTWHWDNIIIGS